MEIYRSSLNFDFFQQQDNSLRFEDGFVKRSQWLEVKFMNKSFRIKLIGQTLLVANWEESFIKVFDSWQTLLPLCFRFSCAVPSVNLIASLGKTVFLEYGEADY